MSAVTSSSTLNHARNLINFIDRSPTPYHAVATVKNILLNNNFREIDERNEWDLKPNDLVFVTKNYSTIIAMAVGGKYKPGNGFTMIGAHTDSPCLRLKPISEQCCNGYTKLGVETYGGGLWYTWFDRDLTLAGRCIVRDGDVYRHCLVNLQRPVARVPSLAIHLDRTANDSFAPNKESHLSPVLCTILADQTGITRALEATSSGTKTTSKSSLRHPTLLMEAIATQLNASVDDIVDLELCFADTQQSTIGGLNNEFIFAPRLDNLFGCYSATEALVSSLESVSMDPNIRVVCLFDNEEVGSGSAQGAMSAFTEFVLRRAVTALSDSLALSHPSQFERGIANSLMVSADQAHAVHPNHEEKHERQHRPLPHQGIVLKINSNQRYASNAITTALMREVARKCEVPLQDFVVRQDMACGSTIGPILAAKLGLATVDVGGPQLSMHSCREMTDVSSAEQAVRLFRSFFELFPELSRRMLLGHQ